MWYIPENMSPTIGNCDYLFKNTPVNLMQVKHIDKISSDNCGNLGSEYYGCEVYGIIFYFSIDHCTIHVYDSRSERDDVFYKLLEVMGNG